MSVVLASLRRLTAVTALVAIAVMVAAQGAHAATAPKNTAWVGLISPSTGQLSALSGSSVRRVVEPTGWNVVEPANGQFNEAALAKIRQSIVTATTAGLDVVLDLGLQYPPAWVFALPGPTRFVNQYGDVWHGVLSEDVPNAVFDPAVRTAESLYLATLGRALAGLRIVSIRVGGLLSGELRFPPSAYNGHTNSIWDYDSAAQQNSPVRGWIPGTGSTAQARAGLAYYFAGLTGYLINLMGTVENAFPRVDQEIMFPSWGLRPGMVTAAIAGGLHGLSIAELNGEISAGLDWDDQVKAVAATGYPATVYSTWVDAPSLGTSSQLIPPVAYLAGLAHTYGLPLAGENTGAGGSVALTVSLQRIKTYHLTGIMYMCGAWLANGIAGVTLPVLVSRAKAALAG